MKKSQSTPIRLQPLTPADLVYIADLAAEHSVGIEQRCARYRRRASIRRTVVAACFLAIFAIGADTAYADHPAYTEKAIFGDITPMQVSDTVNKMLGQI